jgi:magnesium chelatase family protein
MYGKIISGCVHGIDGQLIEVEVDLSNGLPQYHIVGLPDSAVRESMERVRAAIKNCKLTFPMERITVNLAPADLKKEGSSFDLAIALGILITSRQAEAQYLDRTIVIGELALDGSLRPVPGVLSMVQAAKSKGLGKVILPAANAREAALIEGIDIWPLEHLTELTTAPKLINDVNNKRYLESSRDSDNNFSSLLSSKEDYADVQGQHHAKRALIMAAAGMHNILFIGPPGSGKTMLLRRLPTILPPLTDEEALEVTRIYSVANKLADRGSLIRQRPFRCPHHTVSQIGLIGGGSIPKPGEVSMAHRGILFLDEFPEFSRQALEVLRQPLEDRRVTISRARGAYTFPAHFMLGAAMNPCPCGYLGAETISSVCRCSPLKVQQYRSKLSGPLLDRIDLHVEVPRADLVSIRSSDGSNLSSAQMADAVRRAQQLQQERYASAGLRFNGELSGKLLRKHCMLDTEAEQLFSHTFNALSLSVRAHDKILKLARTIADVEGSSTIKAAHLAEAFQYRSLDRNLEASSL